MSHEFSEDVADGSMCICGVPALTHHLVEKAQEPNHRTELRSALDSELDSVQIPNIRAANEHLHKRIAELESRAKKWQTLYYDAAVRRDELEVLVEVYRNRLNAQLNGDAA